MILLNKGKLKAVLTHAATDDIRYYLNGVLFEVDENQVVWLIATDGHRLFAGKIGANQCEQKGPFSIIIPGDAVKRACTEKTPTLTLCAFSDGRYALGSAIFTPVEGKFPDWRRVCPAVDAERADAPLQFNWDYVATAQKALRLWDGSEKAGYALRHLKATQGLMHSRDESARIVIMPMNE